MRSWFTFCMNRGICILDNSFHQAVDTANRIPSIAGPDGHAGKLLEALKAGGHWISLEDTSDLPFIGVMGKEQLGNEKDPSARGDLLENLIVVGQEPIYFDKPIPHPLVFPCLARWLLGHNEDVDRYDIGGERDNNLMFPVNDAFRFRVVITASREKSALKTNNPNILRLKIRPDIPGIELNKTAAPGEHFYSLPTVIVGRREKTVAGKGSTTNEDAMMAPISWFIKAWHNETELGMITRPVEGTIVLESNPTTLIGMEIQNVSMGNKISCGVHFKDVNAAAHCKADTGSFFEIGSE